MRKMKKMTAVLLCILMAMSMLGAVSYAAETECEHNFNPRYIDGKWYEACDFCDAKTCACSLNGYDYEYGEDYTYEVCNNCGKKTVFCDHSEYEFVNNQEYAFYCNGGEVCKCGKAVVSGTKHQFGDYVCGEYDNGYFVCELCDRKVFTHQFEYANNYIYTNDDGTFSGKWATYDYDTGLLIGSGDVFVDRNYVITVSGEGVFDGRGSDGKALYGSLADIVFSYKECELCDGVHGDRLSDKITKWIFGEGITEIRDINTDPFGACPEIVLPDSLEKIALLAAPQAVINIPKNLKTLGENDEYSVILAKEFNIDKNNSYFTVDDNGSLYSKDMKVLYCYKGTEKELTIPESVEKIAYGAFIGNKYIENVTIPSSVKEIGEDAFNFCINLKRVSLSSGLKKIGSNAFEGCIRLEEIVLPDTVTEIGASVFSSCFSLEYVHLPKNLKEIPKYAFAECMSLKTVTIPESIKKIGRSAFDVCVSLEEINVCSDDIDLSESKLGMIYAELTCDKEEYLNLMTEAYSLLLLSIYPEEYDEEYYGSYINYYNCIFEQINDKAVEFVEKNIIYHDPTVPSTLLTIYCHEGSTAEAYAIENGIKYVAEVCEHSFGEWVADAEKGIKYKTCSKCGKTYEEELTADDDNIGIEGNEGENKFTVKLIENPESTEYIYIRGLLEGNIIALYDINLLDENGNKVQPDGMVKVSLPLGEDVKYFTVLRVNDDGTLTDMKAVREGDSVVFETDHFSYYVILGGETEADTGDNIKCNCFCHKHPLVELIVMLFKILTKFFGGPLTFYCDC